MCGGETENLMPVCETCGTQLLHDDVESRCPLCRKHEHLCGPAPARKLGILEEALRISGENRQRYYGHPLVNHERIAATWNVVLGPKLKEPITPEEVVWCMVGLKLAREVNRHHRDNALDVAGYINCLDLIQQARENREANQ